MATGPRPWVGALVAGAVLATLAGTAALAGGHGGVRQAAGSPDLGPGVTARPTTTGGAVRPVARTASPASRATAQPSAAPTGPPAATGSAAIPVPLGVPARLAAGDYLVDAAVSAPAATYGTIEQTVGSALPARAADFMALPSAHHVLAEVRVTGPGDVFTIVGRSTRVTVSSITAAPAQWGLVVRGQQITGPARSDLVLHGVNAALSMGAADFQRLTASFPDVTVVRVTIDEQCWDPYFVAAQEGAACRSFDTPGAVGAPAYRARVAQVVQEAESSGRTVVIGVDDAARDDAAYVPRQQDDVVAPDQHTLAVYRDVATEWKGDRQVAFETFNEPKMKAGQTYAPDGLSGPALWRDGGRMTDGGDTWRAPGEQQIVDTIRTTGATNLVMVQGESWGEDLSPVEGAPITGTNLLYSVHAYNPGQVTYDDQLDTLSAPLFDPNGPYRYAGFMSEFGTTEPDSLAGSQGSQFLTSAMDWADAHHLGWAAWGWFPSSWGDAYALLQAYQPLELNGKGKTVAARF